MAASRWSRSSEPTNCSATTASSWGTASTFPWCRRSASFSTDCLWSPPTGSVRRRARRPLSWRRTSRDLRRLLPHLLQRSPNQPRLSQRSCQPKTSYTDWTCKLNSQSRLHAGSKKRKWGEGLSCLKFTFCFLFKPHFTCNFRGYCSDLITGALMQPHPDSLTFLWQLLTWRQICCNLSHTDSNTHYTGTNKTI